MAKFSKTFLNLLFKLISLVFPGGEIGAEGVDRNELSRSTTLLFKGSSLIDAGDIIYFSYNGQERLVFVVKARGGSGTYNTPRNNKVISGFMINDAPPEVIVTVLKGLYKNAERYGFPVRMLLSYKAVKGGFNRIFRASNFRTFRTNRIEGNINQLVLNIPKPQVNLK